MSLSNDMEFEYEGSALAATTNPITDTTPVESRSRLALGTLPPYSAIFPSGEGEPFWVVPKDGGFMEPIPTNPILQGHNVSQCSGFANGTVALVPAGYKEFIKVSEVWKRVRTADSEGVNVVTTRRVIGPVMTFDGEINFLEVQHPKLYTKGGNMATPGCRLQDVSLQVPLSRVDPEMILNSGAPALSGNVNIPNKLCIIVQVSLSTGEVKTFKGLQFNTHTNGSPITVGQLAAHAATVVTGLMTQARGERSILCVNGIEIDSDDLLLEKLEQVSQGSLRVKLGVRDFQLPAGLAENFHALQARIP